MRIDEVRKMRDAAPFRPFDIHLADGRAIAVENHDFIMLSPTGRTALVYQRDGSFDIIELMMVTSLKAKQPDGRPSEE